MTTAAKKMKGEDSLVRGNIDENVQTPRRASRILAALREATRCRMPSQIQADCGSHNKAATQNGNAAGPLDLASGMTSFR